MRCVARLFVSFLLLAGAPASAQDSFEQPVMGTSHDLPDGVPSGNSDDQLEGSASPDADLARSGNPDAITVGPGQEVQAHSVNPDSITTTSEDLTDLPSASVVDRTAPASLPPAPPLPLACAKPAGDGPWTQCLGAIHTQLQAARERLAEANAAYSRSITMQVPTGDARLAIIQDRDRARADVQAYSAMLDTQYEQARQAGVSSFVTAPYDPSATSTY